MKKSMKLKENTTVQIVFCVVMMALLCAVYFPLFFTIKKISVRENALLRNVSADNATLAGISKVEEEKREIVISGWGIRLNSKLHDICVVLVPEDREDAESIVLNAKQEDNSVVKEYTGYLGIEEDHGKGFVANIKEDKLQDDICYKVQVYMSYQQKEQGGSVKIATNQYLYQDAMYDYNPLEFTAPEFVDKQMKQVVENGNLMGYTMEHGAWIYLYENSLYWILDKQKERNLNKEFVVFSHINTTNSLLLSESRRTYGFDNKDFLFSSKEIAITDSEKYRVAALSIEFDYPITYVLTGEYDPKSGMRIWETRFKIFEYEE